MVTLQPFFCLMDNLSNGLSVFFLFCQLLCSNGQFALVYSRIAFNIGRIGRRKREIQESPAAEQLFVKVN